MFGRYFFYPWGLVLQAIALVHFVKRRPENYWIYIILFGGSLGAGAYILVEVIPDLGLLRGVFQGFGRRSRIQTLQLQILDNPSAGNYEELGELCLEQKQYAKGREAFDKAIAARADSPHAFYHRAQCSLGLNDLAAAIPDLERVVSKDIKFRSEEHTSELQSRQYLVCRLLLEKKKTLTHQVTNYIRLVNTLETIVFYASHDF